MPQDAKQIVLAPAKVNLTLGVLGKREDGFHEIESWVVKIGWYDRLSFLPAGGFSLSLGGEAGGVAGDESNLVMRAARALAEESGHTGGAAIKLEKSIPVGAGLGGGSSDAAATLKGLNVMWGLNWGTERLQVVGARIGSDVPLFLEDAPSLVIRGRGERIEPLPVSPRGWLAIVVPPYSIATADVYRAVDLRRRTGQLRQPWRSSTFSAAKLQVELFNDLEPPAMAVEPRLARLHAVLHHLAGRSVHLTGSGSCLYAVFDEEVEARAWKDQAMAKAGERIRIEVVAML
jgi:4-diphosphocytidyl-2-C-methyl-D-erythritol kinase